MILISDKPNQLQHVYPLAKKERKLQHVYLVIHVSILREVAVLHIAEFTN